MLRLTRQQVRQVDRIAIERYGIPGIVLMENAARGAADVASGMLGDALNPRVLVVCGGGNNGGDGYAIARHLDLRGCRVDVVEVSDAARLPPDAGQNRSIARRIGTIHWRASLATAAESAGEPYALVIDAIFGTGLSCPPEGAAAAAIEAINHLACPILAIDLPSGLDCDTGKPLGATCVRANATVTFVAEKAGFANPRSSRYTGTVHVSDIGTPPEIVARVLSDAENG